MDKTESPQLQWLQKQHAALQWRLSGPNVHNPYDALSSEQKLRDYVADRFELLRVCRVQGFLSDALVVQINDMETMEFRTDHPNLVNLLREDLEKYLKSSGVWETMASEFKKLQQLCQEELKSRTGKS